MVSQSSRKFGKCALASTIGLPQDRLACTMLMRLDLSSKFISPNINAGSGSHTGSGGDGEHAKSLLSHSQITTAFEMGSCAGRIAERGTARGHDLLTSFSGHV